MMNNFVSLVEGRYGLDCVGPFFLFEYFTYQYDYWFHCELGGSTGKFQLSWIIGEKALDRFEERFIDMVQARAFIRRHGLSQQEFEPVKKSDPSKLKISEENDKKIFHNTDNGYGLCVEATTLINLKSPWCEECIFQDKCKDQLKRDYPLLYIKRGFEESEPKKERKGRGGVRS